MPDLEWTRCINCRGMGYTSFGPCHVCHGHGGRYAWHVVPEALMPPPAPEGAGPHSDEPARQQWWNRTSAERYPDVYMHQCVSPNERRSAESAALIQRHNPPADDLFW